MTPADEGIAAAKRDAKADEIRRRMKILFDLGDCSVGHNSWKDTDQNIIEVYSDVLNIESLNIKPEGGAAKIVITLSEGSITVTRGTSPDCVLLDGDVQQGAWDKLFDFLENDLGLERGEQNET